MVAVAYETDPDPVTEWFREQGIHVQVNPKELAYLHDPTSLTSEERSRLQWHQEPEWALLWVVGKIEALGLPARQCDTRRLVDEIIPALGSYIEPFLMSAELRPPGVLLAKDDRHYDLWCRYIQARLEGTHLLPGDLQFSVLYERQYAFGWLHGIEEWDDVRCDA